MAHGLSLLLGAIGWLLAVLPVWATGRIVGYSPLARARSATAWESSEHAAEPIGRRSGSMSGSSPRPGPRRVARNAVGLLLVAALCGGVVLAVRRPAVLAKVRPWGPRSQHDLPGGGVELNGLPVDSYAHEDEPWAKDLAREINDAGAFFDFFLGARPNDFEGRYLTIRDHRRVSYVPEGAEVVVWFFGGSTMYGVGQRDLHTLPSVVARLAERDGIRIEPVNFGMQGYVNWTETQLFAMALTSELPKPDLVVFYDGVNDRGLASQRVETGRVDPEVFDRLTISDAERERARRSVADPPPVPDYPARTDVEVELAAEQYRRGVEVARHLGEAYDVEVVHLWQPQPFAKRPSPADDELYRRLDYDPADLPSSTDTYRRIRESSGVEPIDLTTALDRTTRPVYFDSSHTNELGARIIARAMYAALEPRLRSAAGP